MLLGSRGNKLHRNVGLYALILLEFPIVYQSWSLGEFLAGAWNFDDAPWFQAQRPVTNEVAVEIAVNPMHPFGFAALPAVGYA